MGLASIILYYGMIHENQYISRALIVLYIIILLFIFGLEGKCKMIVPLAEIFENILSFPLSCNAYLDIYMTLEISLEVWVIGYEHCLST